MVGTRQRVPDPPHGIEVQRVRVRSDVVADARLVVAGELLGGDVELDDLLGSRSSDPHVAVGVAFHRVPAAGERIVTACAGVRVERVHAADRVHGAVEAEFEVVAPGPATGSISHSQITARSASPDGGGGTSKCGSGASGEKVLEIVSSSTARVSSKNGMPP